MNTGITQLVEEHRVIVLMGDGGVGKTSMAAGLALAAAESGRRVACLTVDPAPRLGQALGLASIEPHAQSVETRTASSAKGESKRATGNASSYDADDRSDAPPGSSSPTRGALFAMRLDTKRTFDELVIRLAGSEGRVSALLENPIYAAVSGVLGGSEHYMTFERLYELTQDDEYDLLIVDTPPAADVRELLRAPARLAGILESGAMDILSSPARILSRASGTVARGTFSLLLLAVRALAGRRLEAQVAEFIDLFKTVLESLESRAQSVRTMLAGDEAAVVLVTRARATDIERAAVFFKDLSTEDLKPKAIIVNRCTKARDDEKRDAHAFDGAPTGTQQAIEHIEADLDHLRAQEREALELLRERTDTDTPIALAPAHDHDIIDLDGLRQLTESLRSAGH